MNVPCLSSSFIRIAFTVLMVATLSISTTAQEKEESNQVYIEITYMKSTPGQDYVALETDKWQKIHQQRIKEGTLAAWHFFAVDYPYGSQYDYDYAIVNVYTDFAHLERGQGDIRNLAAKALPGADIDQLFSQTGKARTVVRVEVFSLIDEAVPGPGSSPADYVKVNYMKHTPGKARDYVKMEREVYKPVHQAAVKKGLMNDWLLFGRVLPNGADFGYHFITVDVVGSYSNIMAGDENLWSEVHPGVDQDETYDKMRKLRTLRWSELWRRLGTAIPEAETVERK